MDILFLLSHIPDPRINKRISIAQQCGKVAVICVRRTSQDIWEPHHVGVPHNIIAIDLPSAKHIIRRFFYGREYRIKATSLLKYYQPSLIYTEGLDSLSIAVQYKKSHKSCAIFYEVADLREVYLETPKSPFKIAFIHIIKAVECRLLQYINRLIITSEKFYDLFYNQHVNREKILFVPNVPDSTIFSNYQKKQDGPFTIGFIGAIRYIYQMKMLVDTALKCDTQVLFAGKGGTVDDDIKIHQYCQGKKHVTFYGRYVYEREIAYLYEKIDCVFAVYDADNPNVQIALPNKLYESIYCELPIIVAKGTYLSEVVKKWGVGISVSHNDQNELAIAINMLKQTRFRKDIAFACQAVKKDIYRQTIAKKAELSDAIQTTLCSNRKL